MVDTKQEFIDSTYYSDIHCLGVNTPSVIKQKGHVFRF